ncbi:conserved hypothetical protein [Methanocaldococcus infernus ME]|uniref:Uncharacterized protein n=1 Tax=Methanocaldococcus infernus (strain DSM 11812 / JCM 15783 / ME) TaxID=573063 RepID=D5VRL8_METIM|nr:hypothetical protein [Methanocaldococcus infernus]ADG13221.1 conserved hypothetical protein [Methanocaldococcus infernus ME]
MKRAVIILILFSLLFCGCTTSKTNVNTQSEEKSYNNYKKEESQKLENNIVIPKKIEYLWVVNDGDRRVLQVALADENGRIIRVNDGFIYVEVYDESGKIFEKSYPIKELENSGGYYIIKLPEIKGVSEKAKFVVHYKYNNIDISKEAYGTLPRYSLEEINKILDKKYHEHSIKTHVEAYREPIKVRFIVTEYGPCKFYNTITNKIESGFRVDFTIENENPSLFYLTPTNIMLLAGDKKYGLIYGPKKLKLIYDGDVKSYWIFRMPETTKDLRLRFEVNGIVYDLPLNVSE